MKKIISLLLALMMILSLTACASDEGFKKGEVEENVYTNDSTGVSFTAPEGFEFYSEEQIASMYGTTVEVLNSNTLIYYDMQCANPATNSSVTITYEDLASLYGYVLDDDAYLTLSLASIQTSFESMDNVKITAMDQAVIDIDGTEYNGANVTLNIDGTDFYETIVIRETDGYMMCFTAAAYDEAEIDTLLEALDIAA